ncbi:MAG: phosphopantothenoylcysteine decarboxylase [Leptospiraceae bacterium]|nr:phosphopantothenoylcysteine decarboxylase [Leptospiraceae bacterium]MDW8306673.1 phosphopantothenoylcysteine decarboxylase [Leptospiraceae bacterium]
MANKRRIVVTSGPTREFIDPIRFISNPSTGKMGYHIAKAAVARGYEVVYIVGPGDPQYCDVVGAKTKRVISTEDMLKEVLRSLKKQAILIMAAAPADYRPEKRSPVKLKKTESPELKLIPNPDILKTINEKGLKDKLGLFLVGFAAETHNGENYALKKLEEKNLDIIFLNDLSRKDSGFAVETNQLTLFTREGRKEKWKTDSKEKLGEKIISTLESYFFR